MELPPDFIHEAPEGYAYEIQQHKRNIISIWCRHLCQYNYNGGDSVSTIWGFYNTKTKCYHAPINSRKLGDTVDIQSTTPYTSMQLNRKGLELLWM